MTLCDPFVTRNYVSTGETYVDRIRMIIFTPPVPSTTFLYYSKGHYLRRFRSLEDLRNFPFSTFVST